MAERWYARLSQAAAARAERPPAAHPLRRASALPADQHPRRRDRRGHRRRHRDVKRRVILPVRRRPRGNRSRARPRAGARVPVRHRRAGRLRGARGDRRAERCRCGSSKAWPSTCRSARSIRTPRCGCATPSSREKMPIDRQARRPRLLPVSLRPCVLGVRRRPLGRSRRRRPAARDRSAAATSRPRSTTVLGVDEEQLTDGLARRRRSKTYAPLFETHAAGRRVRPRARSPRERRRRPERHAGAQPRRQARRVPVGEVAVLDRHVRRRRRDRQDHAQAGRRPTAIRTSTACSSSTRRATGRRTTAGSCSPRSRKGQPVLTIVDVDSGKRAGRARVHGSRSRSTTRPGRRTASRSRSRRSRAACSICSSTTSTTKQLTQLTDDRVRRLDPEWSPDGSELAWVTDRFSSNLDTLPFGNYRIGLIDVDHAAGPAARRLRRTGATRTPSSPPTATRCSSSRRPTASRTCTATELSPAARRCAVTNVLSGVQRHHAADAGAVRGGEGATTLVFTVFEDDHYNIYAADRRRRCPARRRPIGSADARRSCRRSTGMPDRTLPTAADAGRQACPSRRTYPSEDYKPKLQLDDIVAADRRRRRRSLRRVCRRAASRSSSATCSATISSARTVQLTSRLEEIGGAAMYLNRTHRWNWGLIGEQMPYVTGGFRGVWPLSTASRSIVAAGGARHADQQRRHRRCSQYPFSRAQRVEVAAACGTSASPPSQRRSSTRRSPGSCSTSSEAGSAHAETR